MVSPLNILAFLKSPLARYIGLALLCVALVLGLRHHWVGVGVKQERAAEAKRLEKAKVKVAKREVKADAITSKVATERVKEQARIEYRTKILVKEIPTYVSPAADSRCILPVGWVRLHDAAASGSAPSLSQGPGGPLDAPSGVQPSEAITSVIGNYGVAYSWRAEAMAWREWYVAQKAEWEKP